jgi:endonuclease-8
VPEGDTIHKLADRLRPALAGQPLVRLEVARVAPNARRPAPGTLIAAVEAVGKHLLIRFADGAVLRTHLRMNGSWRLYRPGEAWRRPAHLARAVVEVPGAVAVCFAAPVAVLEHERIDGGPAIGHLGPDLARPDLAADELEVCVDRMGALADPDTEIADVLLDQRIANGVGNVFKSEVLWACRVDPFARLATVDEATRRRLVEMAAKLLRVNSANRGRRTTHDGGLAVYRRRGRGCPRCGTAILMRRQGKEARSTYWCPRCQSADRPAAGPDVVA